jgi:hypothetical protein
MRSNPVEDTKFPVLINVHIFEPIARPKRSNCFYIHTINQNIILEYTYIPGNI